MSNWFSFNQEYTKSTRGIKKKASLTDRDTEILNPVRMKKILYKWQQIDWDEAGSIEQKLQATQLSKRLAGPGRAVLSAQRRADCRW